MSGPAVQRPSARAAAYEATRERILAAAEEAFGAGWYDDVTLRDVAAAAGVALQTVVNHFGTKEELFAVVAERMGDRHAETRFSVAAGDVDGAIAMLVADYERTGDRTIRTLAVEEKVPIVRPMIARGRQGHEAWIEHVFGPALEGVTGAARRRRVAQLVVATDVYAWKLLRRDKGFGVRQTETAMRELVLALIDPKGEPQ
jgi:AcrR family transcriptional regulator